MYYLRKLRLKELNPMFTVHSYAFNAKSQDFNLDLRDSNLVPLAQCKESPYQTWLDFRSKVRGSEF